MAWSRQAVVTDTFLSVSVHVLWKGDQIASQSNSADTSSRLESEDSFCSVDLYSFLFDFLSVHLQPVSTFSVCMIGREDPSHLPARGPSDISVRLTWPALPFPIFQCAGHSRSTNFS